MNGRQARQAGEGAWPGGHDDEDFITPFKVTQVWVIAWKEI